MKKIKKLITILILSILASTSIVAQEAKDSSESKFAIIHNWGLAFNQVTRIQKQVERSNFVWREDLVGAFYSAQTVNLPVNFIAKVGVYYPIGTTFNFVPQVSKQILLYGFDFNAGPIWTIPIGHVLNLSLSPVIEFRYQIDDNFHKFDLGAGIIASMEFPISRFFTIMLNGEFTYDFGNLGTNAGIRNYDAVYSYGAQLGFRISKAVPNNFYYFGINY